MGLVSLQFAGLGLFITHDVIYVDFYLALVWGPSTRAVRLPPLNSLRMKVSRRMHKIDGLRWQLVSTPSNCCIGASLTQDFRYHD